MNIACAMHHLTLSSEGLGAGEEVSCENGSEGTSPLGWKGSGMSTFKGSGDPIFNLGFLQGQ